MDIGLFLATLAAGIGLGHALRLKRFGLLSMLSSALFAASSLGDTPLGVLFLLGALLLGMAIGGYVANIDVALNALLKRLQERSSSEEKRGVELRP